MYFEKNSHYGKQTFWEKRYAENCTEFDWYQNWEHLRDIISQFIKPSSKILNVGAGTTCNIEGNSGFSEDMYKEGYKHITNIDFSEIVVEDMQIKYGKNKYEPTMKYLLADVKNLKGHCQNESFDCVIDKGLLDSVLCGAYSKQNSKKMLKEISRVLKTKGYYICVSYGDPDIRLSYFDDRQLDWARLIQCPYKIFKQTIEQSEKQVVFNDREKQKNKDYYHYVYIMQKGVDLHGPMVDAPKSTTGVINSSSGMVK